MEEGLKSFQKEEKEREDDSQRTKNDNVCLFTRKRSCVHAGQASLIALDAHKTADTHECDIYYQVKREGCRWTIWEARQLGDVFSIKNYYIKCSPKKGYLYIVSVGINQSELHKYCTHGNVH